MKLQIFVCLVIGLCVIGCIDLSNHKQKNTETDVNFAKGNIVIDTIGPSIYLNEKQISNHQNFISPLVSDKWPKIQKAFPKWIGNFDTVKINNRVFYLAEGDILFTKDELLQRFNQRLAYQQPKMEQKEFVIIGYDYEKKDTIKWRKFPIKYSIDKKSFEDNGRSYDSIVARLSRATAQWHNICNVSFEYHPELDNKSPFPINKVDFLVINSNNTSSFVATSFSPDKEQSLHYLILYKNYWISIFDMTGVIRHEIGHILGFRHEQLFNSTLVPLSCKGDPKNDPDWLNLNRMDIGTYDKISLMHYYCPPSSGNLKFSFSSNDSLSYKLIFPK
jgi:hypothetical protein